MAASAEGARRIHARAPTQIGKAAEGQGQGKAEGQGKVEVDGYAHVDDATAEGEITSKVEETQLTKTLCCGGSSLIGLAPAKNKKKDNSASAAMPMKPCETDPPNQNYCLKQRRL